MPAPRIRSPLGDSDEHAGVAVRVTKGLEIERIPALDGTGHLSRPSSPVTIATTSGQPRPRRKPGRVRRRRGPMDFARVSGRMR